MSVYTKDLPTLAPKKGSVSPYGLVDPVFTRSGTATRVNASGLIETVAANMPRFNYDPSTVTLKGLLIEEARTNLALASEAFNGVGSPSEWIGQFASITSNSVAAPDGNVTADMLVESNTNNEHYTEQYITANASTTHALSVYAKASTRTQIKVQIVQKDAATVKGSIFNLSTGAVVGSDSGVTGTIEAAPNGFYRCKIVVDSGAGANPIRFRIGLYNGSLVYAGDGSSGAYLWGGQVEVGAFATSYIPTTTVTVTRGADNPSEDLTATFNASAGSHYAEFQCASEVTAASAEFDIFQIASSGLQLFGNSSLVYIKNQVDNLQAQLGAPSAGSTNRVAASYSVGGNFGGTLNGAAMARGSQTSTPSGSTLNFGRKTTVSYLNGHLRKLSYYNAQLSDEDLITLSGGGTISRAPVLEFDFTSTSLATLMGSLDQPRILYDSLAAGLASSSVTASSEDATNAPSDALLRPDTVEDWMPTSLPATWTVDLGAAQLVDAAGIAAHTLGSSGCSVKVQFSGDNVNWNDATDVAAPADDSAILFLFSPQYARYWRLYLAGVASPTVLPRASVAYLGRALVMQRKLYGGHAPITLSRDTVLQRSLSQGGQFLAQSFRRKGFTGDAAFRNLSPDWVREVFGDFAAAARAVPYFFAWRPGSYADECAYVWTDKDIRPHNMSIAAGLMQVSWPMRGVDD